MLLGRTREGGGGLGQGREGVYIDRVIFSDFGRCRTVGRGGVGKIDMFLGRHLFTLPYNPHTQLIAFLLKLTNSYIWVFLYIRFGFY